VDLQGVLRRLTRRALLTVSAHHRSCVFPSVWSRVKVSSTTSVLATPALLDPELDDDWAVIRELIPDGLVRLAVGHLPERAAVHPGHHPRVNDDMVNKLRERVVPAAHRHVLSERGEIRIGPFAVIQVGPDPIARLGRGVEYAQVIMDYLEAIGKVHKEGLWQEYAPGGE
jgi:hypothetical protein